MKSLAFRAAPVAVALIASLAFSVIAEAANRKVERAIKRSQANKAQVNAISLDLQTIENRVDAVELNVRGNAETIEFVTVEVGDLADDLDDRITNSIQALCAVTSGVQWDFGASVCAQIPTCHDSPNDLECVAALCDDLGCVVALCDDRELQALTPCFEEQGRAIQACVDVRGGTATQADCISSAITAERACTNAVRDLTKDCKAAGARLIDQPDQP